MKIFVGIDFSSQSDNSLDYAVSLAKCLGASLTLVNACYYPVMTDPASQMVVDVSQLIDTQEEALDSQAKAIKEKFGDMQIDMIAEYGNIDTILVNATKDDTSENIFVIGQSNNSTFENKLFKSTFENLVDTIKIPVVIVPNGVAFHNLKNIAIFYDGHTKLSHTKEKWLSDFIAKINAKAQIVTVLKKLSDNDDIISRTSKLIIEGLTADSTTIYTDNDITQTIENHIANHNIDGLIIFSKHHSWYDYLINGSMTEELSQKIHIPIIALFAD